MPAVPKAYLHFLLCELRGFFAIVMGMVSFFEKQMKLTLNDGASAEGEPENPGEGAGADVCMYTGQAQACSFKSTQYLFSLRPADCDENSYRACVGSDSWAAAVEKNPEDPVGDLMTEFPAFKFRQYPKFPHVPNPTAFVNLIMFILFMSLFAKLNAQFFTEMGWGQTELNGRYVRWCHKLENGPRYRQVIKWYMNCTIAISAAIFILVPAMVGWEPQFPGDFMDIVLVIVGFKGLLTIEGKEAIIDIDDPEFDAVQFKFLPMFLYGTDAVIESLASCQTRKVLLAAKNKKDSMGLSDEQINAGVDELIASGAGSIKLWGHDVDAGDPTASGALLLSQGGDAGKPAGGGNAGAVEGIEAGGDTAVKVDEVEMTPKA